MEFNTNLHCFIHGICMLSRPGCELGFALYRLLYAIYLGTRETMHLTFELIRFLYLLSVQYYQQDDKYLPNSLQLHLLYFFIRIDSRRNRLILHYCKDTCIPLRRPFLKYWEAQNTYTWRVICVSQNNFDKYLKHLYSYVPPHKLTTVHCS